MDLAIPLATRKRGCYTDGMWLTEKQTRLSGIMGGMGVALLAGGVSWAAVGNGVFQGFIQHIAQQVTRDKADFVAAESCTTWFYQQLQKPPTGRADVQHIALTDDSSDSDACSSRYPGINEARAAFAQSQSSLSFSLTFYQLALVADRDDDERYDAIELKDILDSLNVSLFEGAAPLRLLAGLNGKFDDVRETVEFTVLTESIQTLYHKGYRLTNADQAAMGRMTGAS